MMNHQNEATLPNAFHVASMLRIAVAWQESGKTFQAIDTYVRLLERHPGTKEARTAAKRLVGLAQEYERQGCYHRALSLYEKLEHVK